MRKFDGTKNSALSCEKESVELEIKGYDMNILTVSWPKKRREWVFLKKKKGVVIKLEKKVDSVRFRVIGVQRGGKDRFVYFFG